MVFQLISESGSVTMKSCAGADTLSSVNIEDQDQDQEDGVPDSFISKSNSPAFITVQDEKGNLEQIPVRKLLIDKLMFYC